MLAFFGIVVLLGLVVPVALVFLVVLSVRAWSRLARLELAVNELATRVRSLEMSRARPASPAVAGVAVKPAAKPPEPATQPPPAPPVLTTVAQPFRAADAGLKPRATIPAPALTAAPESTAPIETTTAPTADTLETRIGSRWLLYIGVIAIVIGASYFEKLAIENRWIGETARVLQGGVVGLLLVYAGLRFVRAGYGLYGQLVSGSGVAILYVSTYAAFNFYDLIGQPIAFAVMGIITMLAAWLADRQRSQGLALMAVGGGFATPFLVSSGADAQIALFGYEAILIAGTMVLAHRREWPALNVVSYGFTLLTVASWADSFYRASKYLPTELFLTLFCAMYLYILRECRRSRLPLARLAEAILWTAPVIYYVASLAILANHSVALLVFLLALTLVGVGMSVRVGSIARLGFWFAAAVPLLLWSDAHAGRTWLTAGLATVFGVYVIHLLGHLEATRRQEHRFGSVDIAALHLNGLGAYCGAYLLIHGVNVAATAPVAAMFALWHGGITVAIAKRHRDQALHFAALAFTLLTIAIAIQFSGAWITVGWAAEGAVIMWLGLRERREWLRAGGLVLFGVAIERLIALQFSAPPVGQIVLINLRAGCALFMIALAYGLAWIHRGDESGQRRTEMGIALVTGKLLVLALAVSEIFAYWAIHEPLGFEPRSQAADACLIVGAVTTWLGLVRRQEWIRAIGGSVVAIGAFLLLSAQFESAPPGYLVLWNARAAAGVLAVGVLYGLASLHRRAGAHVAELPLNIAILLTSASLLTLSLVTSEIDAFWAARGAAGEWSMAREGLQAIAWASIGSTVVWLGLGRRQTWIRGIGFGLFALAVLRLLRLEIAPASAAYVIVANPRVTASLVVVALLYGLAHLYRRQPADEALRPRTVLLFMANALTLVLLTSEITAFWRVRDVSRAATGVAVESHFAREMMLSVTWALYATGLMVAGFRKQYAPIRYFAIGVFVITIAKVFFIDLAELDQIYRVASIVGLGLTLLATSYLYHRFRERISRA